MHPNPAFRRPDDEAWLDFAQATGFAHIFVQGADGPAVIHAPVTRHGRGLRFHVARGNRARLMLHGARVLVSISGVQGYVSPNFYADHTNKVPTWNYLACEYEGMATALDTPGLIEQLDAMADQHEPRPDPWTLTKVDPTVRDRMIAAIQGFEVQIDAIRGTAKLSQNKPADRDAAIAAIAPRNPALAEAMRHA